MNEHPMRMDRRGVLHQVEGQPSNGLLVDGRGVEVIAAYSRDHDRGNGAASFIARKDGVRVLVHRLPDMAGLATGA